MSKLNTNDPAESALVNSKFLGRSVDDETTGVLGLNAASSGDQVTNAQLQINTNKFNLLADQTVSASGTFLFDEVSMFQIKRIEGNGGAVTVASEPFGSSPNLPDGTIIYLIGQDDTNTVTIEHNDSTDGCLLNGDATLLKGYCLQLFWDAGLERFIDVGRNF